MGEEVVMAAQRKMARGRSAGEMRPWEYEEDVILVDAIERLGKRWKDIAKLFLPARTDAMCRNRWARMQAPSRTESKRYKAPRNKCNVCGAIKKGHSCSQKAALAISPRDPAESDLGSTVRLVSDLGSAVWPAPAASDLGSAVWPPNTGVCAPCAPGTIAEQPRMDEGTITPDMEREGLQLLIQIGSSAGCQPFEMTPAA